MNRQRGFTVVEVLVAMAILLIVAAAATSALYDGLLGAPVLEEGSDLQQRTRALADGLAADLRAAGSGTEHGPLSVSLAATIPRTATAPATTATASAITIRYVASGGARTTLAAPLSPVDATAILDPTGACVQSAVACGFTSDTMAVLLEPSGQAAIVAVDAIGPGTLTISDPIAPRSATYPAGAVVAEVVEVTYRFDAGLRQLRREGPAGSFPLAEHVTDVRFDYFGTGVRPSEPKPPLGTANCLYAADGTALPYASSGASEIESLPLGTFTDGPFCGVGPLMFDADLLRVRSVRAIVRLETGVDALRGTDPRLFARPGSATGTRTVPDSVLTIDVASRNPGR